MSPFGNRLKKNLKKIQAWARRHNYQAYRVYDLDIPEYPLMVDLYGQHLVINHRSNPHIARDQESLRVAHTDIEEIFPRSEGWIYHLRQRRQREGAEDQYEAMEQKGVPFKISEGDYQFVVNLDDYLDTGLFLDHRPLRQRIQKLQPGGGKFLNLFCYTSSHSIPRARAGDTTYNLDLSSTYLKWSKDNFIANDLDPNKHHFMKMDVLDWLESQSGQIQQFDLILLDPPTFSVSKKMRGSLDIQRDHPQLVRNCLKILSPNGLLIFSSNKRGFKLEPVLAQECHIKDISAASIPQDFHDKKIHVCFEIRK